MTQSDKQITAIALYSGGLDSTLACRVVADQGIRVVAVKFISPFFGYDLLARREQHMLEVKEKFGLDLRLIDISVDYLRMLRNPPHGYGKNFNPCIDCKILMLTKAKELMTPFHASFLITGEVVGQRPMSQRYDTLRVIERDSGCSDILLRPLCAKLLKPTKPETEGLIEREKLLDFNGRTRASQIQLAAQYGIREYPGPAGGCILTDPILSKRIEKYYKDYENIRAVDIPLLMLGRQLHLPGGGWLVLGRDEKENNNVAMLRQPDDHLFIMADRPGPTGLLRYATSPDDLKTAAAVMVRYARKGKDLPEPVPVTVEKNTDITVINSTALDESTINSFRRLP